MHQCLNNGMVGGVHMGIEREGTFAIAIVGLIKIGGDDPILEGGRCGLK